MPCHDGGSAATHRSIVKLQMTISVAGQNSLQALETAISEISPFLSPAATVAILIDSRESGFGLKLRENLERAGFRIEAGVRCQQGFVLCAQRHKFCEIAKAA